MFKVGAKFSEKKKKEFIAEVDYMVHPCDHLQMV